MTQRMQTQVRWPYSVSRLPIRSCWSSLFSLLIVWGDRKYWTPSQRNKEGGMKGRMGCEGGKEMNGIGPLPIPSPHSQTMVFARTKWTNLLPLRSQRCLVFIEKVWNLDEPLHLIGFLSPLWLSDFLSTPLDGLMDPSGSALTNWGTLP